MSYHSLITHNRIAQFAARFEMQANGSVVYFHPDRETGGLPCSVSECEQFIQDYAQTIQRTIKLSTYWAIFSGITIGLLDASKVLVLVDWMQYSIILAPLPCIVYAWRKASLKPLLTLRNRLHCAQPRSMESAFWNRVAALPASLFIAMLLPTSGLIYYAIIGKINILEISNLLIIGSNVLMTGIWLYARFIRKL